MRQIASLADLLPDPHRLPRRDRPVAGDDGARRCIWNSAIPNFGIQEYMGHTAETDAVFPHAYSFADGSMHPGDAPGLGVDIDEALAETSPYSAAPTCR